MKKFTYNLESVLKIKEYSEELAKLEFAKKNIEHQTVKNSIENNDNLKSKLIKESLSGQKRDIDSDYIINRANFFNKLDWDNVNKKKELSQKEITMQKALTVYNQKYMESEIYRKLYAKNKILWHKDSLKKEDENLDDVNNIFYIVNKNKT